MQSIGVPAIRHLDDALAFIDATYGPAVGRERIKAMAATGRILAADAISATDYPRFTAAAMDGIAVRKADVPEGVTARLRLIGRAAAGHPFAGTVGPSEAIRIFTGAPVPADCDLVIMQEHCRFQDGWVTTEAKAEMRSNLRRRGEEIRAGGTAIRAGTRLTPLHSATASMLSIAELTVFHRLRVAVFSSGDELAQDEGGFQAGHTADANRPHLIGALTDLGCIVSDGGILPDDAETQIATLHRAAADHDLIVTSGGMSEGEEDHLPTVIRRRGFLEIWKLKIKPGKPIGIGDIDDCPVLALPGNPVAAAVCFVLFGVPMVERLSGLGSDQRRTPLRIPLGSSIMKKPDRWEALPVMLDRNEMGTTVAMPLSIKGSASLPAFSHASGFLGLPDDVVFLQAGEIVDYYATR